MALTLIALYLFSRESIRIETSSLVILTALAVGFMLFPYRGESDELDPLQFFSGFSNEALIAICALMMASQGLIATGALTPVGRVVSRLWAWSPLVAMGAVLVLTAFFSAFMNNTPQVVLMIPLLTAVAARSGMSPAKVLMPMTFASQIGGMGTPIGTSLNLLVIGTAASLGVERFHMFDFAAPAALAALAGIAYLWFVAPRLLPDRQPLFVDRSTRVFEAQLHIGEDSAAAGLSLIEANKLADGRMTVQGVRRAGGSPVTPLPDLVLQPGDRVVVRDTPERLMEFAQVLGAKLYAGDVPVDEEHPLTAEDQQTAELVLTPTSPLRGRSLAQSNFDWRYQVVPLAIHRPGMGQALGQSTELRDVTLGVGDVLLVQGPAEQIQTLKQRNDLLVLDATTDVPQTSKAPIAMAVMAGIILAASFRIFPHPSDRHRCGVRRAGDGRDGLPALARRHAGARLVHDHAHRRESRAQLRAGDHRRSHVHRQAPRDREQQSPSRRHDERDHARDGAARQRHLEQRGRRDRHADCGGAGASAWRGARAVRAGGAVRRQHELRHAHGGQLQPAHLQRRRLRLQGFRQGRRAAAHHHVVGVQLAAAAVLSAAGRLAPHSSPCATRRTVRFRCQALPARTH
jgi:di/tricarboxylate transporter